MTDRPKRSYFKACIVAVSSIAVCFAGYYTRRKYAQRYHVVYQNTPQFFLKGRLLEENMRKHPFLRVPLFPLYAFYWVFPFTYSVDQSFISSLRYQFRAEQIQSVRPSKNHTHGAAAALRTTGRNALLSLLDKYDLRAHEIAGSAITDSSWQYHFPTDAKSLSRLDTDLAGKHALLLIDVDYYLDMPKILVSGANNGLQVCLMYTMNPDSLTGTSGEAVYWFERDRLHCHVAGGGHYTHYLWNYGDDSCLVVDGGYCYIFLTERKALGDSRYLVALFYLGRYTLPPEHYNFVLRRQNNCVSNGFIWRMFYKDQVRYISVASLRDSKTSVTVTYNSCAEVFARSVSTQKVYVAQLEQTIKADSLNRYYQIDAQAAAMLALWINSGLQLPALEGHFSITPSLQWNDYTYEPVGTSVTLGKPTYGAAIPPVLDAAVAPTDSLNSEECMVNKRIIEPENVVEPPEEYHTYAEEFFDIVLPPGLQLTPFDQAQVLSRQTKPTQKAKSLSRAPWARLDEKVSIWTVFQKRESYDGAKAPRPIANPSTGQKEEYSKFTYPLFDYFAFLPWFAFGKPPGDLASLVHGISARSEMILESDFSNWDGHHSKFFAEFEQKILWRVYPAKFRSQISRLWSNHYNVKGVTKKGIIFSKKFQRPSGSPDTALFNTVDNAFVAYCAYRRMGMSPPESYSKLGLYGGDDGFTPDMDYIIYKQVVDDFGLKFTGENVSVDLPITFLGRVYPQPRLSPASFLDVRRALSKLHLVPLSDDPKVALANKLFGYLSTDPDLPFFSPLCRLLIKKYDLPEVVSDSYWAVATKESGPFPCAMDEDALVAAIANNCHIDVVDLVSMIDQIAAGVVPKFPEVPIAVKVESVLRGRIVKPPKKEKPSGAEEHKAPALPRKVRRGKRKHRPSKKAARAGPSVEDEKSLSENV